MPWLPIVFVILVVLMMIALGYYLIRSFLREYTYDLPSKTQSKCAIFWNMRNLISSKYIGRSRLFNNGSNTG
jgi:uncharacterized protein YneF (UPF0154 family)